MSDLDPFPTSLMQVVPSDVVLTEEMRTGKAESLARIL